MDICNDIAIRTTYPKIYMYGKCQYDSKETMSGVFMILKLDRSINQSIDLAMDHAIEQLAYQYTKPAIDLTINQIANWSAVKGLASPEKWPSYSQLSRFKQSFM